MKIKLIAGLFITGLVCFLAVPVFSEITVEQVTSDSYMRNSGYSETMIDMVNFNKSATNNTKYVSNRQKKLNSLNPVSRFLHKVFSYADPAQDDGDIMTHDIKMYPTTDDL